MKLNETKYGFKLVSSKEMKDLKATLHEFHHAKSGATLVYLECDDTNMVFGVGFKTLPEDSTGVCHIIEHSLLCGSEKYPLKEPFVNLIKGSLNTYLNAMTAADWTMYPVASQTPKDFANLMSVYCDAVFRPMSMKDPRPFLQEGWHLELESKDKMPLYKGVVYNEMKGSMSNVHRVLTQATAKVMYKDNLYRFNSGGDPDVIPELTYEAYQDFYRRHYTPENALTFLYGKMDIEEKLKFLDEEYFSKYTATGKKIIIPLQKEHIDLSYEEDYAIGEEEDTKDNTYMSLCYSLGKYENYIDYLGMQVLVDALFSTNNSPLKKALLDAKLGQEVSAWIDDDNIQPALYVNLDKTNHNKKEEFRKIFLSKVAELVKNGIDKKSLIATINKMEYVTKAMDTGGLPKGIVFFMSIIQSYIYDCPLEMNLSFTAQYESLRKGIDAGYYESLL